MGMSYEHIRVKAVFSGRFGPNPADRRRRVDEHTVKIKQQGTTLDRSGLRAKIAGPASMRANSLDSPLLSFTVPLLSLHFRFAPASIPVPLEFCRRLNACATSAKSACRWEILERNDQGRRPSSVFVRPAELSRSLLLGFIPGDPVRLNARSSAWDFVPVAVEPGKAAARG